MSAGSTGWIQYSSNGTGDFGATGSLSWINSFLNVIGNAGLGTAGSNNYGVNIDNASTGTVYYGVELRPQLWTTDASTTGSQRGLDCVPNFTNGDNNPSSQIAMVASAYFGRKSPSGTVTNAYSIYASGNFSQHNDSSTITNYYGMLFDGASGGSGVINSYGLYVSKPNVGVNRYSAYLDGPVSIGSISNMIFSVNGNNSTAYGVDFRGIMTGSTALNGLTSGFNVGFTLKPRQNVLFTIAQDINPVVDASNITISNAVGLYMDAMSNAGTGTITNAYGLYINNPTVGTNKYCAYLNGGVGIGTTPPTSAGLTLPTAGGTAANLDSYETLSNSGTWQTNGGGGTASATVHVYTYKIGAIVTILAEAFSCTTSGTPNILKFSVNLPARFRPSLTAIMACPRILSSGVERTTAGGFAVDTAGGIYITFDCAGGNFPINASCGLGNNISCSYNTG